MPRLDSAIPARFSRADTCGRLLRSCSSPGFRRDLRGSWLEPEGEGAGRPIRSGTWSSPHPDDGKIPDVAKESIHATSWSSSVTPSGQRRRALATSDSDEPAALALVVSAAHVPCPSTAELTAHVLHRAVADLAARPL